MIFHKAQIDNAGFETLECISKSSKFNIWMYSVLKKHCFGKIIEIGSGLGNISSFFLRDNYSTILSDKSEYYCHYLTDKFSLLPNFGGCKELDIVDPDFEIKHKELLGTFDSVVALNVIEHVEDDVLFISNCYKLMKQGGVLVLLAPAYNILYNGFDKNLGHIRRYTIKTLSGKIKNVVNLRPIHKQYFNFMGLMGWFVYGTIFRNNQIKSSEMQKYEWLVRVNKILDLIVFNRFGLSVIIISKKEICF